MKKLIRRLKRELKKAPKLQRPPIRTAIRNARERLREVRAEARSLGFDIADMRVDILEIEDEMADVAGTPDDAPDYLGHEAAIALARLTPGTGDDLAALTAFQGTLQTDLAGAVARGDNEEIIRLAGLLESVGGSIADLQGSVEENTQALLDLKTQQAEQYKRAFEVSQAQYPALAQAFAHWISGQIGGAALTRMSTPSYSGGVARF